MTRSSSNATVGWVVGIMLAMTGCATSQPTPIRVMQPTQPAVAAADAETIDAEAAKIFAGQHFRFPPLEPAQGGTDSPVAVIVVVNSTPYKLLLLYSGPTSQRLTLESQATGMLRVQPGDYLLTASAQTTEKVTPFAGKRTIQGGRYTNSWFIESKFVPGQLKY